MSYKSVYFTNNYLILKLSTMLVNHCRGLSWNYVQK